MHSFVCLFICVLSLCSSCSGPSAALAADGMPSGFGSRHTGREMGHREFRCLWILALLGPIGVGVGLLLQGLVFFHSETELSHLVMDETLGIWGQSFVFISIKLTITHILLCVVPKLLHLLLHGRILFPLATVCIVFSLREQPFPNPKLKPLDLLVQCWCRVLSNCGSFVKVGQM